MRASVFVSLNSGCFNSIFKVLCPFECLNPSSILSKIMPSGLSGICSVAEMTFTPLSRNVFLCIAVSYLLRENLSNLYTVGKNIKAIKEYIATRLKQDKGMRQMNMDDLDTR